MYLEKKLVLTIYTIINICVLLSMIKKKLIVLFFKFLNFPVFINKNKFVTS